ncbi:MAG: LysR family transcriptional regulator [Myxococcota bacterium]
MRTEPSWELWRSFLAVTRSGSLSGAARDLGLTQPTVGRHVDALESALGVPLFTRSPAGLRPTAAASRLLPQVEAMAAVAGSLVRSASEARDDEGGVVRVTASEIVGVHVLPPILAEFRGRFPRVALELELSDRDSDLLRRDADIAVRMHRPEQGALVARRVGTVALGLYAHRRYLEAHGEPASDASLLALDLVGVDRDVARYAGITLGGRPVSRDTFSFRADSDLAQLAAVRAGLGVGPCQVELARRHPELVPVLADRVRYELEMWVVTHEDLFDSRSVRALFEHLAIALARYTSGPTSLG